MNILMCTPRMGIGGAETHILTLASELVRLGHRVTVASSGGLLVPSLEKSGVRHLLLPLDKKNPGAMVQSLKYIKAAAAECDIVHAHGRYPAFLCGILSGRPDFPAFVTTAHGITGNRQPQRALSRWGESTVSVSDAVSDYLQRQHRVPEENIRFIPNGVCVPAEDTESSAFSDGIFRIAAAGRFEKDTAAQFLLLIDVTERLLTEGIPARLILFGGGKKEYIIGRSAGKVNRKYPGSIVLPGETCNVSEDLKSESIDVFVGQSRSALEAMAAGIATVIFSEKGCPGVLSPKNAELLFRSNYMPINDEKHTDKSDTPPQEALFTLLRQFALDAEVRRKSAVFAQDFVRTRNALSDIAGATLYFYAAALKKHRPGVVLSGYFGAENLGDEETLHAVTKQITETFGPVPCYVITRNIHTVPAGCTGIRRTDTNAIRRALRASRLFVLCGGSLLQNATSNRSLWYYSALFRCARKAGCRTQIFGGGIGPLYGSRAETTVRALLSDADAIGLRDAASFSLARKYSAKAYLSADAALKACFPAASKPGACFAVCPRRLSRKQDTERLLSVLSSAASVLQNELRYTPKYCALSPEDLRLCARLAECVPGEIIRLDDAAKAIGLLSGCAFSVAVRLHAAEFSLCAGIPAVCISYDPKIDAFAAEAGFPCIVSSAATAENVVRAARMLSGSGPTESILCGLTERQKMDIFAMKSLYYQEADT